MPSETAQGQGRSGAEGRWPGRLSRADVAFFGLLAAALLVRIPALSQEPLWVDEAESAINALSILQRGYPGSEHLGVPIFENMLVRPWPGHAEYEFKDISYSDRGMAVYHGWLPLAAIAASFAVAHVEPPTAEPGWQVKLDEQEWRRRTVAARLPALVFTALFLTFMYRAGRLLVGADTALAAGVIAGFSYSLFDETSHARYHVATLALGAAACMTLWRIRMADQWRDYLAHAAVLILLFHTNVLACVTTILVTAFVVLAFRRTSRSALMLGSSGVIVLAGIAPWIFFTGYLDHLRFMPSGRPLLDLPGDLERYAFQRLPYLWVYSVGLAWLGLVTLLHGRGLPRWLTEPWERHSAQYTVLIVWMVLGAGAFAWFMPPASLFPERLSLQLFVPGLLLLALLLTDVSRLIWSSRAVVLAPLLAASFLAASGLLRAPVATGDFHGLAATFATLNRLNLRPDARVYASPSSQLVLMFYGDKPFQSIAPVRKAFLDGYSGDVVYIEGRLEHEFAAPDWALLRTAATRRGETPSDDDLRTWVRTLRTRYVLETLQSMVARAEPPLDDVPQFAEDAMAEVRAQATRDAEKEFARLESTPIFRGFRLRTNADLWQTFFYRLVNPPSRSGRHFNAAARLARGCARPVPEASRVVFYSPGRQVAGATGSMAVPCEGRAGS